VKHKIKSKIKGTRKKILRDRLRECSLYSSKAFSLIFKHEKGRETSNSVLRYEKSGDKSAISNHKDNKYHI
jgi:hypothetical protein